MRATGLVRAYFNLRIENTGVGIGLEIKFFKACTFHKKKDQRNGIILLKFHPCLIYYLHISYITRICRWKSWPHRIAAAIEYTDSWRMYVCVCVREYTCRSANAYMSIQHSSSVHAQFNINFALIEKLGKRIPPLCDERKREFDSTTYGCIVYHMQAFSRKDCNTFVRIWVCVCEDACLSLFNYLYIEL